MSHLLEWRIHKCLKQTLNVLWFCTSIQPWPGSLAALVCLRTNFNIAVCSLLGDDFGDPWANWCRTQNCRMAHVFITLSSGQLEHIHFLFHFLGSSSERKCKRQPGAGFRHWKDTKQLNWNSKRNQIFSFVLKALFANQEWKERRH